MTTTLTTTHPNLPAPALAAEAWEANLASVQRAREAAADLLTIDPATLTPEQDAQLETYLVKARRTLEQLQTRRAPLTKAFDAVRAQFVTLEAELDPKKGGSLTARLQATRDAYAARLRQAELQRQDEIRQRAEAARQGSETDRVQLVQEVEQLLAEPLPEIPKGRAAVAVTVTDPQAYVALLALYLERERRTLDQLSRLTLGQLVTFAERLATSTGELLEVPGLQYAETFKTVAR